MKDPAPILIPAFILLLLAVIFVTRHSKFLYAKLRKVQARLGFTSLADETAEKFRAHMLLLLSNPSFSDFEMRKFFSQISHPLTALNSFFVRIVAKHGQNLTIF